MAAAQLHLTITRVYGPVFDGSVTSVTVPGVAGEMTLLAHHTALITPLAEGLISIKHDAGEETFPVTSGTLEVSDNHATILL